jgi:hypothetical protein
LYFEGADYAGMLTRLDLRRLRDEKAKAVYRRETPPYVDEVVYIRIHKNPQFATANR